MDNPRPEKVAVVDEVRASLDGAESVVLTEYRGLSAAGAPDANRSGLATLASHNSIPLP